MQSKLRPFHRFCVSTTRTRIHQQPISISHHHYHSTIHHHRYESIYNYIRTDDARYRELNNQQEYYQSHELSYYNKEHAHRYFVQQPSTTTQQQQNEEEITTTTTTAEAKASETGENVKSSSSSSRVEVRFVNEKMGRGVFANTFIKRGELIVVSQSYANVLDFDNAHLYCHNCFSPIFNSIDQKVRDELEGSNSECEDCGYVVYCSPQCRQEYHEPFHKKSMECDHLKNLLQYLSTVDNHYVKEDKFTSTHMMIKVLGRRALELMKKQRSLTSIETLSEHVSLDSTSGAKEERLSESGDKKKEKKKDTCCSHHHLHHHSEMISDKDQENGETSMTEQQEEAVNDLIYEDYERLVSNRSLHTNSQDRLVLREMAFVLLNHVLKQRSRKSKKMKKVDKAEYHQLFEKGLDNPEIIEMLCKERANSVGLKGDRWERSEDYIFTHPEDPVGYGVFPTMSYFNHSCSPNCENIEKDMKIYVYAVRDIEPDEQLTISYVNLDSTNERRKKALQSSFLFTCECAEGADVRNCNREFLQDHMCPNCRKSLLIPVEGGPEKCLQCGYVRE